jgi:hypothetical protein
MPCGGFCYRGIARASLRLLRLPTRARITDSLFVFNKLAARVRVVEPRWTHARSSVSIAGDVDRESQVWRAAIHYAGFSVAWIARQVRPPSRVTMIMFDIGVTLNP